MSEQTDHAAGRSPSRDAAEEPAPEVLARQDSSPEDSAREGSTRAGTAPARGGRPGRAAWVVTPIVVGACALAVLGVGAWGASRASPAPELTPPLAVEVSPVRWERGYTVTRRYVGQVEARRRVDLAFELGGTVEGVWFDEGDRVSSGDAVAALDTSRLRAERDRLAAQREEAAAELRLARLTLERTRASFEGGAANRQEVDRARHAADALAARERQAAAAIERLDVDLAKSELRAPFDSIVAQRRVDEGAVLAAGAPVLRLLEADGPEVRVGAPVGSAGVLESGAPAEVRVRGRSLGAEVIGVSPELDRVTRTASLRVRLSEPLSAALRDGDAAEIAMERRVATPGFWIPKEALTQSVRGLWAVFVVAEGDGGSSVVERREVEVVHPETGRAYVRGPISEGAEVVVSGRHRVTPGLRVRPRPAAGGER